MKNGRVLTAKHVSEEAYQAVHLLPYGNRQQVLKALLNLLPEFAAEHGNGWHLKLIGGEVELYVSKHHANATAAASAASAVAAS
jgi:hypothetical protein